MKVLSLLQPWAQLVVIGAKRYETRGWCTGYRGPLLVHASKRFTHGEIEYCFDQPFRTALKDVVDYQNWSDLNWYDMERFEKLPLGKIIGQVELVDCIRTEVWKLRNIVRAEPVEESLGRQMYVKAESQDEYAFGNYEDGRFAWELKNPVKFDQPIPAKGSLGLWEFPESALGHLAEKLHG